MEIVIEILIEIYMELMLLIVPEKNLSQNRIRIAKILAILVTLGVVFLFLWGLSLILEGENPWGILPFSVAILLSLAQIIAGILLYRKHH